MNAEMGPAIRILRSGRLVPAQRAARVPIQPYREPSLGRLVVQNNRITKGIGEGAATTTVEDSVESQSAVGGGRYRGEIVVARAFGIIERHNDLVGVIWVSISVGLRLDDVWRGLCPSDQVDIRGAKGQRDWQQFSGKLGEGVAR